MQYWWQPKQSHATMRSVNMARVKNLMEDGKSLLPGYFQLLDRAAVSCISAFYLNDGPLAQSKASMTE